MPVLERLKQFIVEKKLFKEGDRILLAVSGGKDSMLMARLFHDLKVEVLIAHCNFQLRAEESDKDEALVLQYAQQLGFPILVNHFDTLAYAKEHKCSVQMAARDLRYAWFETLRIQNNCKFIAIAQHANDHVETMLLNLTRSTGIQGILGIQPKREHIIRPLLFLTAEEVAEEVITLQVPYRDDQSNFSTKYARNKIRLEIIPKFKEIQPEFESVLSQNMLHFEESFRFIQRQIDAIRNKLFVQHENEIHISKSMLAEYLDDSYVLFELFKPYHFQKNILEDLATVFNRGNGQIFQSDTHELLLDRQEIILKARSYSSFLTHKLENLESIVDIQDKQFYMEEGRAVNFSSDANNVQIDQDLLQFPLTIRSWQQGDHFKPLGMKGTKKISDYFIQQKLNRYEKDRVPILVNANGAIIWILGMRLDNRFKVTENTKKVLTLVYK